MQSFPPSSRPTRVAAGRRAVAGVVADLTEPTGARATAAETAAHPTCRELTDGFIVSAATGTRASPAQETAWQFAAGVAVQTYQSAIMSGPLRKSSGRSKLPPNLTKRTLNTRSASREAPRPHQPQPGQASTGQYL